MYVENKGDKLTIASRYVLASYLFGKNFAKETDIKSMQFELPVHKEIQSYIIERQESGQVVKFNDLYEELNGEGLDELGIIAGLETEENNKLDQATYFFDCVKTIKIERLNKDINRLTSLFETETDTEKRKTYAKEMGALVAQKKKLI